MNHIIKWLIMTSLFLFCGIYYYKYYKRHCCYVKGITSSPNNENYVINYSPSLFIFETQIEIFLMKSASFLTAFCVSSTMLIHWLMLFTVSGYSPKWRQGDKWLNKVIIFVFFAHKKYSRSFWKLWLNP